MVNFLTLDKTGALLAVVFGVLIYFFGQGYGPFFLLEMLLFLAVSALVTRMGIAEKKRLGVYEKTRGWKNVVANGLVPLAVSFMYFLNSTANLVPQKFVVAAYVAAVAAITADKFASEVGTLDGAPIMLLTLERVKKGASGAVTMLGLAAALIASFLISLSVVSIGYSTLFVIIIAISGIFGEVIDSVLGYFEERGIGNKFTSNFFCSLAGSLACAFILIQLVA